MEEVKETTPPQGDLGAARSSRERVAGAPLELACVVAAKEADTRTANSITSDREPLTQGESVGTMPEPFEVGRDKESRPNSSGSWHRKSRPVPTLACSKEEHVE